MKTYNFIEFGGFSQTDPVSLKAEKQIFSLIFKTFYQISKTMKNVFYFI